LPEGGGHRNALPLYQIRNARILYDFVPAMPLRVSALRSLGAYMNIFSIESFMDELAQASETDPIDVRLRHLDDPRARDVITAAAERFGWSRFPRKQGSGRGFAFARYKNLGAYAAVAVEVSLDHESGRVRLVRAAASVDSGQAVNPDAIRNQIEGGHSPICELDALRKHHLLPDAHHEPRLEQLSDPALFGGAGFG